MLKTPSIAQLPDHNAFHGFGFVTVMLIVPMVVTRQLNYVVSCQTFHFLSSVDHQVIFVLKYLIEFQINGDAVKKVFNAITDILLALTQHFFVIVSSNVLMAVMKNLAVG